MTDEGHDGTRSKRAGADGDGTRPERAGADEDGDGADVAGADTRPRSSKPRCDFCRMPIPEEPVEATVDGDPFAFCSNACRDAMERAEYVFTEFHGHRRITPGVAALDESLPQGFPRNAFVLVPGEAGTRDRALGAELVWRTLQRGEPVVFVSFQEPPSAVVQQFITLEWNVLPYLESGLFHIVDCFTYRLDDRDRMFERMDDWNAHLYDVAEDATTTVRDPTDVGEVHNKLDNALEARDMVDTGLVIVDSLTELGTLVQPVQAYNFVKDVRADVCKGRFVPVFAGATISAGSVDAFPHDLQYVVDGLIELRLNEDVVPDTLIKEVRIRKLNGVLVVPEWHAYEYTSGIGMVTFDPEEEVRNEQEEAADSPSVGGESPDAEEGETTDAESGGGESAGPADPDEGAVDRAGVPDAATASDAGGPTDADDGDSGTDAD